MFVFSKNCIVLIEIIPMLSCFNENEVCWVYIYCALSLIFCAQLVLAILTCCSCVIIYFQISLSSNLLLYKQAILKSISVAFVRKNVHFA